MKKSELTQLKGLDIKQLNVKAKSLKEEIANLTLDKNTNKLKDKKSVFKKRKELAKVLTIKRQMELLKELEDKIKSQDATKKIEVEDKVEQKGEDKKKL